MIGNVTPGLCSPGRIRPGLRAKRAMKVVHATTNAGSTQALARVASRRGAEECLLPYTIDVETR